MLRSLAGRKHQAPLRGARVKHQTNAQGLVLFRCAEGVQIGMLQSLMCLTTYFRCSPVLLSRSEATPPIFIVSGEQPRSLWQRTPLCKLIVKPPFFQVPLLQPFVRRPSAAQCHSPSLWLAGATDRERHLQLRWSSSLPCHCPRTLRTAVPRCRATIWPSVGDHRGIESRAEDLIY